MAWLRDCQQCCTMDGDQTFRPLRRITIGTLRVADAIERDEHARAQGGTRRPAASGRYHAHNGSEAKAFDFNDVAAAVAAKMGDRHPPPLPPHCLLATSNPDADAQTVSWKARKGGCNEPIVPAPILPRPRRGSPAPVPR